VLLLRESRENVHVVYSVTHLTLCCVSDVCHHLDTLDKTAELLYVRVDTIIDEYVLEKDKEQEDGAHVEDPQRLCQVKDVLYLGVV